MSNEEYPVIDADGEELFFPNMWRTEEPQTLGDTDCFNPDAQPNENENLIVMKLTGQQLLEMLSALYIGAEFVYPEKYLEVLRPLLAATACPPQLEEQECYEYPTYAGFIRYTPSNPYIEPDTIPDGYEIQPFLVNGENGNNVPNYEHFDIIVPSAAITLDIDWWTTIAGQLPTIEIMVQGAGKAFLKMLTLSGGGLAVITLDNPPDLLDIIGGIVTAGENIIDLNQDLVSLPPETAQELIFELDVVGTGLHTIYIVFLPILDDSLIPVRFGGGFRGVQLCDFVPQGDLGVQSLRFEDCNLEMQGADGTWSIVPGWENWLNCVPSGGGGGGVAAVKASTYSFELPANQDTTSTATFVEAAGTAQAHQFTYANALIFAECQLLNTNAGSNSFVFVAVNDNPPAENGVQRVGGNAGETLYCDGVFNSLDIVNPSTLSLYFRASANTARIGTGSRMIYTILEYADAGSLENLFVQDIQYVGGILQKKINNVWINVVDIAALIAPAMAAANNAAAAAAAAQASANNALTVANGAVTVNNQQNNRLDIIEDTLQDLTTIDIPQINLTLANHEARIDALEAEAGGESEWGGFKLGTIQHTSFHMNPSQGIYSGLGDATYSSGGGGNVGGWRPGTDTTMSVIAENAMRLGTAMHVGIVINNYANGGDSHFYVKINGVGDEVEALATSGSGVNNLVAWINVVPSANPDMLIQIREAWNGVRSGWQMSQAIYLCVQTNPFTLVLF